MKQINQKVRMEIIKDQITEAFAYSTMVLGSKTLDDSLINNNFSDSEKEDYSIVEREIDLVIFTKEEWDNILFQIKNLQFIPDVRCEAIYLNINKLTNQQ